MRWKTKEERQARGMPKVPRVKTRVGMEKWSVDCLLHCQTLGLGRAVMLRDTGYDDPGLHSAERLVMEKLFGALLCSEGPLSEDQALRDRVVRRVMASPDILFHGGRVFGVIGDGCRMGDVPPPSCNRRHSS